MQTIKIAGPFDDYTEDRCTGEMTGMRFSEDANTISFGSDSKFYDYQPRDNYIFDKFVPNTNLFIRWLLTNHYSKQSNPLVISRNAPQHFIRRIEGARQPYYEYDKKADFRFVDKDNLAWPVTFGGDISNNGEWMVIQVRDVGIVRLNLKTFEARQVAPDIGDVPYNLAYRLIDFAISNDGRYIALKSTLGTNSEPGVNIYDVSGTCSRSLAGKSINDLDLKADTPVCPHYEISEDIYKVAQPTGAKSQDATSLNGMKFNDDATELTFESYLNYATYRWQHITLGMPGYTRPSSLDYLAQGDSLSSGEGDTTINPATNAKYYRNYTNNEENLSSGIPREKCHLSTRSYPYLLARSMNLALDNPKQWNSVACSGATTTDMLHILPNLTYGGQAKGGNFVNTTKPRLEGFANMSSLQTSALNSMIPGRIQQIDFVKRYRPKTITLTAGANDIDFGGKMRNCTMQNSTCDWSTTQKSILGSQIQSMYPRLVRLYTGLAKAGDQRAKVYVLGYPEFISDTIPAKCKQGIGQLNDIERTMIAQSTRYLNTVIKAAASAAGVKYVDISAALAGNKLCEGDSLYMNGFIDFAGVRTIGNALAYEVQEAFHPNDYGHIKITQKIKSELGGQSLLTYMGYPTAPDADTAIPAIPAEFGVPSAATSKTEVMVDPVVKKTNAATILQPIYTFRPGSQVTRTLRSDPTDLGTVTATDTGALKATVIIPSTVPAGYHTLILRGETYSGEPLELTQSILVTGTNPSDLDENNTPDTTQKCGLFMPVSGKDADYDGIDDACDPQITEPILYIARNGNKTKGEDPTKLYLYRNTLASTLTGVTTDYVKTPATHETLLATSLTPDTQAVYNKLMLIPDPKNTTKKIPIIIAKTPTNICIALQPTDLSPTLNPTSSTYKPRGFTRLTTLPQGGKCE